MSGIYVNGRPVDEFVQEHGKSLDEADSGRTEAMKKWRRRHGPTIAQPGHSSGSLRSGTPRTAKHKRPERSW